jgi:hypothetical protein
MKTFEFPLWEIKLENGKILTEARYRLDVLTEPEVSNDFNETKIFLNLSIFPEK